MRPSVTLIHGDCLEVLRTLEPGSVDAVVTDPPYGQTNESYDTAVAACFDVWAACYRLARPGAALVTFTGQRNYHRIASAVEGGGWTVRQMWAWVFADGFMTSAYPKEGFDRLVPAIEPIVYATKGRCLLKLQREGEKRWTRRTRTKSGYSDRHRDGGAAAAVGSWPRSVVASEGLEGFQYFARARTNGGATEKAGHPNAKPVGLMCWLVAKMPGATILDPFMGSGTTGVAAIRTGRNFIGIEIDEGYCKTAHRRIADEQAKTALLDRIEEPCTA